jgi:hypothetical protein
VIALNMIPPQIAIFFDKSTFPHAGQREKKAFFHAEITFFHAGITFFHAGITKKSLTRLLPRVKFEREKKLYFFFSMK